MTTRNASVRVANSGEVLAKTSIKGRCCVSFGRTVLQEHFAVNALVVERVTNDSSCNGKGQSFENGFPCTLFRLFPERRWKSFKAGTMNRTHDSSWKQIPLTAAKPPGSRP